MAILKELTANILVNERPCREYDRYPECGQGSTKITKYIEAISGVQFKIHVDASPSFELHTGCLAFIVLLDGYRVSGQTLVRRHCGIGRTISQTPPSGQADSRRKSFFFSKIKRTQGQDPLDADFPDDGLRQIGTILVEVHHVYYPKKTPMGPGFSTTSFPALEAQMEIPEEKLRQPELTRITHSTRLVEEKPCDNFRWTKLISTSSSPFAVFEFRYSSRSMLESLGLFPFTLPFTIPFRPLESPRRKSSMGQPLTVAELQKQNIDEKHDAPMRVEAATAVAGKRKRDARDKEDSDQKTGKSMKCPKATEKINLCGEDD